MAFYIYSHEALPNPEMLGKPGYTPDGSWIRFGGVTLPALPARTWVKLDQDDPRFVTLRRRDWTDRQGTEVEVRLKYFVSIVKKDFADRGVVMLDHEPSAAEKQEIERVCGELNQKFRKKTIEFFENQRDMAKARQGTYEPTPYIDECYDLMNMPKPYSAEAMKAARQPGQEAADKIADAIAKALKSDRKDREEAAVKVADAITQPPQHEQRVPAARR